MFSVKRDCLTLRLHARGDCIPVAARGRRHPQKWGFRRRRRAGIGAGATQATDQLGGPGRAGAPAAMRASCSATVRYSASTCSHTLRVSGHCAALANAAHSAASLRCSSALDMARVNDLATDRFRPPRAGWEIPSRHDSREIRAAKKALAPPALSLAATVVALPCACAILRQACRVGQTNIGALRRPHALLA